MTQQSEPDELTRTIAQHLELDHQYVAHLDPDQTEQIAAIRSAGRKAGRLLGWRIFTYQTDPALRDDGKVVVLVCVKQSVPEYEERLEQRSELLMREMFKKPPWNGETL